MTKIPTGFYLDSFEPRGPVEVLGEGYDQRHNTVLVVVRIPDSELFELVSPNEFYRTITVKDGEGKPTLITRYLPAVVPG